ncbi:hypothetical protein B0H10DRAFT_1940512 [Mycena sp. CBHHK59/15]|nr:hypothetical protein B0H10DRAFT_1940512 [Mycena sp. CBHHK59/15]
MRTDITVLAPHLAAHVLAVPWRILQEYKMPQAALVVHVAVWLAEQGVKCNAREVREAERQQRVRERLDVDSGNGLADAGELRPCWCRRRLVTPRPPYIYIWQENGGDASTSQRTSPWLKSTDIDGFDRNIDPDLCRTQSTMCKWFKHDLISIVLWISDMYCDLQNYLERMGLINLWDDTKSNGINWMRHRTKGEPPNWPEEELMVLAANRTNGNHRQDAGISEVASNLEMLATHRNAPWAGAYIHAGTVVTMSEKIGLKQELKSLV